MYDFATDMNDGWLLPEAICVLAKGIVARSSRIPSIKGQTVEIGSQFNPQLSALSLSRDALYVFYHRIMEDVISLRMKFYDIDSYYSLEYLE